MPITYITTPAAAILLAIAIALGWRAKKSNDIYRRLRLTSLSEFLATGAAVLGMIGGVASFV